MRLVVLGPNWNPLVEPYAGGQEAIVASLVRELRARGHEVTLYAATGTPDDLADRLVTYVPPPRLSATARLDPQLPEPRFFADHHAFTAAMGDLAARRGVDLVLNHSLHHLPLALSGLLPAPVLTTLHTPPLPWLEAGIELAAPTARFAAVSAATAAQWTTIPQITVIPNGVDERLFTAGPGGDDLVWVGRITPEKGLPLAIAAARAAGRRLRIVGPPYDARHYREDIRPLLGPDVVYLGHLSHVEVRDVVARSAACLVTPRWDEPFGLVAAEAMMCGTPVVALARGGLVGVVGPGGGVLVREEPGADLVAALAQAIVRADEVDRREVRADALRRLSLTAMLDAYEGLMAQTARVPSPRRLRAAGAEPA